MGPDIPDIPTPANDPDAEQNNIMLDDGFFLVLC